MRSAEGERGLALPIHLTANVTQVLVTVHALTLRCVLSQVNTD